MLALYLSMLERPEDEAAFTELYYKYLPLLTNEAQKFFKGNSGLDDDALSLAWEVAAKQFVKISAFSCRECASYLVIIVKNKCRDIWRNEKRHWEYAGTSWEDVSVLSDDVIKIIIEKEDEGSILDLFQTLRDPYGEVMERRYVMGENNQEIAKKMGVSPSLASKWYERAREKLSVKLMGEEAHHE